MVAVDIFKSHGYERKGRYIVIAIACFALLQTVLIVAAELSLCQGVPQQSVFHLLTATSMLSIFSAVLASVFILTGQARLSGLLTSVRTMLLSVSSSERQDTRGDLLTDLEASCRRLHELAAEAIERENFIADYSSDCLFSLDRSGLIRAANQGCLHILDRHPFELVGKHISDILVPDDSGAMLKALDKALSERTTAQQVACISLSNGKKKYFQFTIEYSSTHQSYFCSGKDVSAQTELEIFKEDFTSMVVHDLRTPLSSLWMAIELLLADATNPLTEPQQAILRRCIASLERLLNLVNSLLDLSKLEAGRFKLEIKLVLVESLFVESFEAVKAYAASRQVEVNLSGALKEHIAVDAQRVMQVLINLLSNAIKYSPLGGQVELTARKGARMVTIMVRDNGPGVPEAYREKIFERYEQVAKQEQKGTTGLGLFICRSIVENHGGNIGVKNEPGQGASFWFTVPGVSSEADVDPD